jgi:hypothetical protein
MTTAPVHIMLDLETWGTDPGDDIRSIGACVFDPDAGTVFDGVGHGKGAALIRPFYIATDNPRRGNGDPLFDLRRNPETVKWWNDQSEEARAAFENPVRLDEALTRFAEWLVSINPEVRIYGSPQFSLCQQIRLWSHGENMDEPILRMAFKAVGLPAPWHYRTPRDTRTMFEAAGMDAATCVEGFRAPGAVYHHALDDAITQARAICHAFDVVRGWKDNAALINPAIARAERSEALLRNAWNAWNGPDAVEERAAMNAAKAYLDNTPIVTVT